MLKFLYKNRQEMSIATTVFMLYVNYLLPYYLIYMYITSGPFGCLVIVVGFISCSLRI